MDQEKKGWKKKAQALMLALKWTYASSPALTIIVFLASTFAGLLVILEPYVLKLIIDRLVGGAPSGFGVGLSIVGILVLYGTVGFLRDIFYDINYSVRSVHGMRIERHVVHELMKKVSSLDLVYFEDPEYYNTLSRANQSLWRFMDTFWQFAYILSEFVSILVIINALVAYDYRLVLLILAGAIPGIILSFKSAQILWTAFAESSPISRHAYYYRALLTEQPEAIKEIKLFGMRDHFLKKFCDLFTEFLNKQDKAAVSQFKWRFLTGSVESILSVFAGYLVIESYMTGKISVGDLTFLWALLFQFAGHTRMFVQTFESINTNMTFITPILDVMSFKPKIKEPMNPKPFPKKIKHGIEFKDVSFNYPKGRVVLKNFNLLIKPTESVAIVGENGSGKTTLIKLVCRLYDVSEGEILIDGVNIKEFKLFELYENLGVIFQDFMKYEAIVEQNIAFGKSKGISKKVHESAVKSGAWDFIKRLEGGYKAQLGKKLKEEGTDLSGGQWQKIALARAFFKSPQILILDEPTAAVDAKAEFKIFQRFEQLTKNKITFLISHRFSTVRMADRIVVMDKGRIIEAGSHEDLLKEKGMYAKLFELQAKGYE